MKQIDETEDKVSELNTLFEIIQLEKKSNEESLCEVLSSIIRANIWVAVQEGFECQTGRKHIQRNNKFCYYFNKKRNVYNNPTSKVKALI